jgi:Acetyltransferase (GNAT) domain
MVFCRVKTWLIPLRLVALPFSDHSDREAQTWRSVELRPPLRASPITNWAGFQDGQRFLLHEIDTTRNETDLFRSLHKDSIQRKIRRAEREGVIYEEGRSSELLHAFYRLTVITRQRHVLPPPSFEWFKNVLGCLGARALIRIARERGNHNAIAAIMTFHHKDTLVYKYGSSDASFHNLGAMPFLLWRTILDAKRLGATSLDLGRSHPDNSGLITFKERFGAKPSPLVYKVYPGVSHRTHSSRWREKAAKRIFAILPNKLFTLAGKLLYPHIG